MASINKVELKAVKTFEGLEGLGLSANIYANGKKIGSVLDVANGGPLNFTFNTKEDRLVFENKVSEYYHKYPELDTIKISRSFDEYNPENPPRQSYEDMFEPKDCFIDKLFDLIELEKAYKSKVKKGYSVLVSIEPMRFLGRPTKLAQIMACTPDYDLNKSTALSDARKDKATIRVFKSLEDFNI